MVEWKSGSQSAIGSSNWSPDRLCGQNFETDFVSNGFAVLEGFANVVELKDLVRLVESILTSSHELACTRPHNTLVPLRWSDPIVRLLLESDARMQALIDALRADDLKANTRNPENWKKVSGRRRTEGSASGVELPAQNFI